MNPFFEWLISIINEFKFWIIVEPWERAVRTRRGKHASLLDCGIHWRIPIIDQVFIKNDRLRTYAFPSQTIATKDGAVVTCAGIVGFRVTDPLAAYMIMMEPQTAISALAQRCVADYITEHPYGEIVVSEMNSHIEAELASMTDGIMFEFVSITEFGAFKTFRLLQENWRPHTGVDG